MVVVFWSQVVNATLSHHDDQFLTINNEIAEFETLDLNILAWSLALVTLTLTFLE